MYSVHPSFMIWTLTMAEGSYFRFDEKAEQINGSTDTGVHIICQTAGSKTSVKFESRYRFFFQEKKNAIRTMNSLNHHLQNASRFDKASSLCYWVNTLRPRQNGRHFTDDILKCIFLNENAWIPIKISLKFVPEGPINNISALVQIMAWRRIGDKPLSEPMMTQFNDAYMRHSASMS